MNEPEKIGEVLKEVRRDGEEGNGAGEGGVASSPAGKNPVVLRLERIAADRVPWSPDGPICPKCGSPWGRLASEQFDAWCTQCAREHPEEYKPVFRAWVIEHRAQYLERAGVPLAFRCCGFDNFEARDGNQRRALNAVKAWAVNGTLGLYLQGPPGTGKTHVGVAALLELIAQRRDGKYVAVHELLLKARESFRDRSNRALSVILDECTRTDALLLDDLGVEKTTEFAREVFLSIADRAYGRRRPVLIVTSNLELGALGRKIDERVGDRLRELCLLVRVGGVSYRRRIAAGRGGRGAQISGDSVS